MIHLGLFDKIFGPKEKEKIVAMETFSTLTGYQPAFHTWHGAIYESELVRAAIDARARHISKLAVTVQGKAKPYLQNRLKLGPNEFQTWSQFLYRLSTILDIQNNAFIVPVYGDNMEISGLYPVLPSEAKLVQYKGNLYVRYEFIHGERMAVKFDETGLMTKFQYKDDFFGEKNNALRPTMELIDMQNQGIKEGIKSSASFKLLARQTNFSKPEDLKKEQDRFNNTSLKTGKGGILLLPNTFTDVKQVDIKPWMVDADQMKLIQTNIYDYFGVNQDVMQNKTYGDAWNSFYEGAIEPFAIQFSEVATRMCFTSRERSQGSEIFASSNRLQYMSNNDKLNVSSQMLDRGILSINEVREIWNLPPVDNGDVRIIRGEYYNTDDKVEEQPTEGGDPDASQE